MSRPLCFTGAVPEVDFISAVFTEECFDCRCKQNEHVLEGVNFRFQDLFGCSYGVCDDGDVVNVFYFHSGDKSSADSHEFGLKRGYIYRVDF